jgi:hypothetical protein
MQETKKYMYRVLVLEGFIQKFEISRVTDKTVFYTTKSGAEITERRTSNLFNWFETIEEAVTFLLNSNEIEIQWKKRLIKLYEETNNKIIQRYKVNAQTYVGSNLENYKIAFVELGEVELEVYNR